MVYFTQFVNGVKFYKVTKPSKKSAKVIEKLPFIMSQEILQPNAPSSQASTNSSNNELLLSSVKSAVLLATSTPDFGEVPYPSFTPTPLQLHTIKSAKNSNHSYYNNNHKKNNNITANTNSIQSSSAPPSPSTSDDACSLNSTTAVHSSHSPLAESPPQSPPPPIIPISPNSYPNYASHPPPTTQKVPFFTYTDPHSQSVTVESTVDACDVTARIRILQSNWREDLSKSVLEASGAGSSSTCYNNNNGYSGYNGYSDGPDTPRSDAYDSPDTQPQPQPRHFGGGRGQNFDGLKSRFNKNTQHNVARPVRRTDQTSFMVVESDGNNDNNTHTHEIDFTERDIRQFGESVAIIQSASNCQNNNPHGKSCVFEDYDGIEWRIIVFPMGSGVNKHSGQRMSYYLELVTPPNKMKKISRNLTFSVNIINQQDPTLSYVDNEETVYDGAQPNGPLSKNFNDFTYTPGPGQCNDYGREMSMLSHNLFTQPGYVDEDGFVEIKLNIQIIPLEMDPLQKQFYDSKVSERVALLKWN